MATENTSDPATQSLSGRESDQGDKTNSAKSGSRRKRPIILGAIGLVVLLGLIGYGAWWWLDGRWSESTDDAYVDGNAVELTPQVSGVVVSITADATQLVHKGQPLVELDPTDADLALSQAEANLAQSVRQSRQSFHTVAQQQQMVIEKRQALQQVQRDDARNQQLFPRQGVSLEQLQHTHTDVVNDESQWKQAQSQLRSAQAAVEGTTPATAPQVLQAEVTLRNAYVARKRTTIVAPVTGYVAQRSVQIGQRIDTGTELLSIVPSDQVWVDANFKETQLRGVRIGQQIIMHSDLYGSDVDFKGKVVGIGLGTGNAFSSMPAQNATGNWIKIVQRVPVRVVPDPDVLRDHPLSLGLSMDVSVSIRDHSGGRLATIAPSSSRPAYSTDVYAVVMRGADALINRIVAENLGSDDALEQTSTHATASTTP
jgi:membrane fusion protein (multidrug efflux system)